MLTQSLLSQFSNLDYGNINYYLEKEFLTIGVNVRSGKAFQIKIMYSFFLTQRLLNASV